MTETSFDQEIDIFLREVFEQNYEELRLDSGHAIAPDVKLTALKQVLLYWRKLRDIASNVTDTEVRLSLPGQETPAGRDFSIEGIVDILREGGRVMMYDIKTHDAEYVRENIGEYEQQLNVYAHIWQNLRRQQLDGTAVIATDFPETLGQALADENSAGITYELEKWEPVVPIQFDPSKVRQTITEFGGVVDQIEDGRFAPPPLSRLNEFVSGSRLRVRFGTRVCRNCDARFSCKSYREYAWRGDRKTAESTLAKYFSEALPDAEQEAWRAGNLDALQDPDALRADFTSR